LFRIINRRLILFIAILVILVSGTAAGTGSQLKLTAVVQGYYPKDNFYLVNLKIKNTGTTECKFWVGSCASVMNIEMLSNYVALQINQCKSNTPLLKMLRPGETMSIPFILTVLDNKSAETSVNFGFIVVNESQFQPGLTTGFTNAVMDIQNKGEQTIWSGFINLDSGSFQPYQIY
jgi:hypothetical protein